MKSISVNQPGKALQPTWNYCVGAGRANEGLRANWQEQLKLITKDCGFRYLRFHGLLCDDMFIYRDEYEPGTYNWQYVDCLFDVLLETGIRPFVEIGFMPTDLASGTKTQFWWKGNITPPKDYDKWANLIEALVRHWISRYGLDEVLNWYFEIWNEPNLSMFWGGNRSEYFKLYRVSVEAIKSVDPRLRVGGPATSNYVSDGRFDGETEAAPASKPALTDDIDSLSWKGIWIGSFLTYCKENGVPVDFLSTHPYPTDFGIEEQQKLLGGSTRKADAVLDDILWLREEIAAYGYPDLPIHLTEWSSSPTSRDFSHDYLPEAAYLVKSNLNCAGLTESLSYWTFTDVFEEGGCGPAVFHGGFGLINFQGIKKPSFHAYRMLNTLGETEICRGENYIVTRHDDGRVSLLTYHYPPECKKTVPVCEFPDYAAAERIQSLGQPNPFELELTNLEPGKVFLVETLDALHGCAPTLWKEMGHPFNLTKPQVKALLDYAEGTKQETLSVSPNGRLSISLTLEPWSVVSVREI